MIGIASGLYIKEIADQLGICSKWVERCRARVFKKLNLPGRVQLTHYALAHGYVKNIYATNDRS
jgi:DNA-binding NarL/FixJ family response regulator